MADKVQKIREEVEKLKLQLLRGACASQVAMETRCKEEAYNEVLAILDNTQEEPVSEDLEKTAELYTLDDSIKPWRNLTKEAFKAGAKWQIAKGESVAKDLSEYINELSKQFPEVSFAKLSRIAVRVAKWQKENLWKPADGDDLPEYDREVIVLTQPYPLEDSEYTVYFAHRPDPKGWDGKSITTGEVEHYTPKTYDKGGWNIPDIKWWLDVELPKEIKL